MKKLLIIVVVIVIAVGGFMYLKKQKGTDVSPTPTALPKSIMLNVATDSKLGAYLVSNSGRTVYVYTKDTPGTRTCTEQCLVNWPPYIVSASISPTGGEGVAGTVSRLVHDDGSAQVTYNGFPLYYYVKDMGIGDTNGQNMGKVWFVVKP